ncbi:MAG: Glu/Leu/Phe/Val dehydrogenase [Steroidobacteraceae bacterium]
MSESPLFGGPVFDMARLQFHAVADHLEMPTEFRERVLLPKRAIAVSCPIHRDDGSTSVFQGYRVQHHLSLGPTKGGTRFAPNVDMGEVAALAVWMSWKCALAGLPYGGGKGGITVDPGELSPRELEALSRRYMQEMIPFVGPHTDVMAPDMGTNEQVMAWFMDTYSMYQGRTVTEIVTGKPVQTGGTVGRREATGRGVAHLVDRAMSRLDMKPSRCTAIVQGFGNVGAVAAATMAARGVRLVGVSDHTAAYHSTAGLDVESLQRHVRTHGVLRGYSTELLCDPATLLASRCDVLVPCAMERVIDRPLAERLDCRILAEGANGPTTPEADEVLDARRDEVFVLPDILCNAGGVIVSYFEWVQDLQQFFWGEAELTKRLYDAMDRSFDRVLQYAALHGISHRKAALAIGIETVWRAKQVRGLFP